MWFTPIYLVYFCRTQKNKRRAGFQNGAGFFLLDLKAALMFARSCTLVPNQP